MGTVIDTAVNSGLPPHYVAAGAREVWIVARDLAISVFDSQGSRADSSLVTVQAVVRRVAALLA